MIVCGLDLSLTGTGMARYEDGVFTASKRLSTPATKIKGHQRLERLLDEIVQFTAGADLVAIESISFGSFDAGKANAGASWIIRHRLWEERIPFALIPPTSRALYATGSGKATKADVMAAVNSDLFPDAIATNDDVADAVVLAAMAQRYVGQPVDTVPEAQWKQLTKAIWPEAALV